MRNRTNAVCFFCAQNYCLSLLLIVAKGNIIWSNMPCVLTEIDNFHVVKDIIAKSGLRFRFKEKKKAVVKENKDLEPR